MIEITDNIASLVGTVATVDNKVVYVKGYVNEGDGGEGMFLFKKDNTKTPNDGVIFDTEYAGPEPVLSGRWIRQYSGYMNVLYFGVRRGESYGFSNSNRIQKAIDYATEEDVNTIYSEEADLTLYFPNGHYFIDQSLVLKDKLRMLGAPGTMLTNAEGNYDYMFKLSPGVVTKLRMENFIINTNEKTYYYDENNYGGTGGIHIKADFKKPGVAVGDGGLWDAVFRNINIINSLGNCIYLEGGELYRENGDSMIEGYKLPNQFMIFDNVRTQKMGEYTYALKMTGQNANYTFLNCEFINAFILPAGEPPVYKDVDGTCIYIGSVWSGHSDKDKLGTNAVSFINSGFGNYSRYGAIIRDSGNITFDTCFLEGMDYAFDIMNSFQINIVGTRFANAAGMGSKTERSHTGGVGNCITSENSIVNVYNNSVFVSKIDEPILLQQKFISGTGNNNVINAQNNSFMLNDQKLSHTHGIMQTTQIVTIAYDNGSNYGLTTGIEIGGKKLVFINNDGEIYRIESNVIAGETFFLRVNTDTVKFFAADTVTGIPAGGNLFLNGQISVTLTNGQGATFIKIDNIVGNVPPGGVGIENCNYQLVSIAD